MSGHAPPLLSYIAIGAIVLVSIWLRARRLTRKTPLRLSVIWIVPVLVLAYGGFTLWQFPPKGLTWLWLVLALILGGGLGWLRGRMMAITFDPLSRRLEVQSSRVTLYLVGGLIALRFGLRALLSTQGSVPILALSQANDILIAFTVALLTVQRLEMALRALRALRLKAAAGKDLPAA